MGKVFQKDIAAVIGTSKSALSREPSRNTTADGYCAETAHARAVNRRKSALKSPRLDERQITVIKQGLQLGWSPENLSYRMKIGTPDIAISHTTVYSRIAEDKAQGGVLYKSLPRFGKSRWKGGKCKAGRSETPNRTDITKRPSVVELRSRLGDWEGDTVYGQDAHLVTLVDRKSCLLLLGKTDSKHADVMINLLKRVPSVCTVTLDNGGEFASHERVSAAIDTDIYFARPYASYQRGTNENTNGSIRRTWPKKMPLGHLTEADLRAMEMLINTMPRKVLGGLTPLEIYTGQSIALIA